jgi:hypothetical protein
MDFFYWNKNFEVGILAIDSQHRRLVEMINALAAAITEGDYLSSFAHFNVDHKVKSTGFSRSALALLTLREWNNRILFLFAGVARLAGAGR